MCVTSKRLCARSYTAIVSIVCLFQAMQIELDRTAEAFRDLHNERQDIINKWDEATKSELIRKTMCVCVCVCDVSSSAYLMNCDDRTIIMRDGVY